jgi:hypothetical protein
MRNSNSGSAHGTAGSPQIEMGQTQYQMVAAQNQSIVSRSNEVYLKTMLPNTAPLVVPKNANIKAAQKNGYDQVKYVWKHGEYKYTCRWHTRTPGAPIEQGNTWVVERRRAGIGSGPNARHAKTDILIGKTASGKNKWVPKTVWQDAIKARQDGTITREQEELLRNGHWKAD